MNKDEPKCKLIIADDHPIFRAGLKTALRGLSFITKIAEAGSGEDVLRLLSSEPFDIVLMDIKMSPMNGIEATEKIRELFPSTRVIALSMHEEEEYIIEIFDKGASGYLIKNADKEDIEKAIREVMDGGQYFSKEVSRILLEHVQRTKTKPKELNEEDAIPKERIREITFLISHEFSNVEIGTILFLSPRTIEGYRSQILRATKTNNLVGLIKFSMESKILDDPDLKKKFEKVLRKKKNEKQ